MNKKSINVNFDNANNKNTIALYLISFIVGIILAVLVFTRVNIPQNPFEFSSETHLLKCIYVFTLFLLGWLCAELIQSIKKHSEIFKSTVTSKDNITFLLSFITLIALAVYLWLFLIDHLPLFICFASYQLYISIQLLLIRNTQLISKTTIYTIISFVLCISQFLIFKTTNFAFVLVAEELSSAVSFLIITIVLTTILNLEEEVKSRENTNKIIGTATVLPFLFFIFNFLVLFNHTYYRFGDASTFATIRLLYKTIVLIIPLVISYYFLYHCRKLPQKDGSSRDKFNQ